MTILSARRGARASLALVLVLALLGGPASAQVLVTGVLDVANTSNPGQSYEFPGTSGVLVDTSGGTYTNDIQLDAGANGTLNANGHSSTWGGGLISGSGALTLESTAGNGVVTLNGTNGYSGGTTIDSGVTAAIAATDGLGTGGLTFKGGTLQFRADVSGLNVPITLGTGGGTLDMDGDTGQLGGLISGAGALTLTDSSVGGAGSVTLTGANNTYSGGTNIFVPSYSQNGLLVNAFATDSLGSGGVTMTGGNADALAYLTLFGHAETIASLAGNQYAYLDLDGGALTIAGATPANTTYAGVLTDSVTGGTLTMDETGGTLTLTGANNYAGGTTLTAGTLAVTNNSSLGSGTLTMYGGALQTQAGLTNFANALRLENNATIDLDGNTSAFTGAFSGPGYLFVEDTSAAGKGVLVLSGAGSWTGQTTVVSGILQMGAAGVMPSGTALLIESGGTFDMNGWTQTTGAINNSGVLKLGAATLNSTVFTSEPGSSFSLVPSSVLNLSANASLHGGSVLVSARGFATGNYVILDAASGVTGTFAAATSCPSGMYLDGGICITPGSTAALLYGADTVSLRLNSLSLSQEGQSRNQNSIAQALNASNSNLGMTSFLGGLDQLATNFPAQLNAALDGLSPITYAALSGLTRGASDAQAQAVTHRASALQQAALANPDAMPVFASYNADGMSPYPLVAEGGSVPVPTATDATRWGAYVSGLFAQGRLDGESGGAGNQPGYGFENTGSMAGLDYRVADGFAVGLAAGDVAGNATLDQGLGNATSNSVRYGAYGAFWNDHVHGNLYLGGADDTFNTNRNVSGSGTASASPNGMEFDFDGSLADDLRYGKTTVTPYVSVDYNHLHVDGFTESGATTSDLVIGPTGFNSLRSTLGVQGSQRLAYARGWVTSVTPLAGLGWEHEYADQSRAIAASFAASGAAFSVDTADVSRDALLANVGLSIGFIKNVTLKLDYSIDYRADFDARTADASLRCNF